MNKSRNKFFGCFIYLVILIATLMQNSDALQQLTTSRLFHGTLNEAPPPPIMSEGLTTRRTFRPIPKEIFNMLDIKTAETDESNYEDSAKFDNDFVQFNCMRIKQCKVASKTEICVHDKYYGTYAWFEDRCTLWKANCYRMGYWVEESHESCTKEEITLKVTESGVEKIRSSTRYLQYEMELGLVPHNESNDNSGETSVPLPQIESNNEAEKTSVTGEEPMNGPKSKEQSEVFEMETTEAGTLAKTTKSIVASKRQACEKLKTCSDFNTQRFVCAMSLDKLPAIFDNICLFWKFNCKIEEMHFSRVPWKTEECLLTGLHINNAYVNDLIKYYTKNITNNII